MAGTTAPVGRADDRAETVSEWRFLPSSETLSETLSTRIARKLGISTKVATKLSTKVSRETLLGQPQPVVPTTAKHTDRSGTLPSGRVFFFPVDGLPTKIARHERDQCDHSGGRVRHAAVPADLDAGQAAATGGWQADDRLRSGQPGWDGRHHPRHFGYQFEVRRSIPGVGRGLRRPQGQAQLHHCR